MRFLVLGASGMAGHTIAIYLKEQGHQVAGFSRQKAPFLEENIVGDACNVAFLSEVIGGGEYDVVVNCVGVLNQYADQDPEGAAYLNGELPHVLARITEGTKTRVFHMSTDCVFAGNTGPYAEDSIPDGKTVYDRTKANGELKDGKNITFRCSIVGPDMRVKGIGLLNWFMAQEGMIRGYRKAIWTGLTTLELAKAIECVANERVSGLVNMVPPSSISKFDLLCIFNTYLRNNKLDISPDDTLAIDKSLVRTNFDSSFRPTGYLQQVSELSTWIRRHEHLYPHYCLE